jgi:acyl carrier protein
MSADPALVGSGSLESLVQRLVADVLVVPIEQVTMERALIADLGAESIDFLDLVFQLEEALSKRIPFTRWQSYLTERFGTGDLSQTITTEVVRDFAAREAGAE